jgi:hypothetical protein
MLWNLWYYLFLHDIEKTSSILPESQLLYNEIDALSIYDSQKD